MTAIGITAIICATVVAVIWLCCKYGGTQK